jgi:TolB-like protein/Tfp pilus assembly protein PilF
MTPEGLKRESEVDRSQSISSLTGRKLDRIIIGIMAVVIAFLVIDRFLISDVQQMGSEPFSPESGKQASSVGEEKRGLTPAVPHHATVAVLPFVNMSGDASNEYFSDGLTETLLHMLAQLPDLQVAARTSSFAFKGQNKGIAEIASTLGVAHILEGSVQRAGERVRVTAQLIRADDGFHVWSQNYDRTLDDIFAIQDEIAGDVAGALGASLLGVSGKVLHGVSTKNTAAYDLYLQALEQQTIFSYGSLDRAEGFLKESLARDPQFIEAKLSLARNYILKLNTGLIDPSTAQSAVLPLLGQVNAQRPGDPLARALELWLVTDYWSEGATGEERRKAIEEMRTLLTRIPADTWVRERVASLMHNDLNKPEVALEVVQAGLMLDPLSPRLHEELGQIYLQLERYDEARVAFERSLQLGPDNPNIYSRMSDLEAEVGNLTAMLNWQRKAIEKDPRDHELVAQLASNFFLLSMTEEGNRWAERCYALAPQTPVCRSLQLKQAYANHDPEKRLELAKAMLKDDVGMRRWAFGSALFDYCDVMIDRSQAADAFAFIQSLYPSIADIENPPRSFKELTIRSAGVELKNWFAPPEETQRLLNLWLEQHASLGQEPFDEPDERIWLHLLRGELETAVEIALKEDLNEPIANDLYWQSRYATPMWRELAQVPEVAARLREKSREMDLLREEVRTALLAPEWNR